MFGGFSLCAFTYALFLHDIVSCIVGFTAASAAAAAYQEADRNRIFDEEDDEDD